MYGSISLSTKIDWPQRMKHNTYWRTIFSYRNEKALHDQLTPYYFLKKAPLFFENNSMYIFFEKVMGSYDHEIIVLLILSVFSFQMLEVK